MVNFQACEVCYVVLVPTISRERLESMYALSDPAVNIEDVLPKHQPWSMTGGDVRDGTFFLWQDVEDLAERGQLFQIKTPPNNLVKNCAEYFGLFQISAENIWSSDEFWYYWSDRFSRLQLEAHCRDSLGGQRFSELRPVMLEMMLLDNFRFRFDPKWRRPWGTDKEDVAQYAAIAGVWFRRSRHDWESRPWRICNLPAFPGCPITNPYLAAYARSDSILALQEYVHRCQQRRRVMEIFPDILYDPISWQDCMRVQISPRHDALSAARNAQRLWSQFPSMQDQLDLTDTEFILAKEVNAQDVFVAQDVFARTPWGINEYIIDMVKADGTVYAPL